MRTHQLWEHPLCRNSPESQGRSPFLPWEHPSDSHKTKTLCVKVPSECPPHWLNPQQQICYFLPSAGAQCPALTPGSLMWNMQNTTESHKKEHLQVKLPWSHKLTNAKNIPDVDLSENSIIFNYIKRIHRKKNRLYFKIISKFKRIVCINEISIPLTFAMVSCRLKEGSSSSVFVACTG